MSTISLRSDHSREMYLSESKTSLPAYFMQWAKQQEKNHIAWVGVSITAMAAVFFGSSNPVNDSCLFTGDSY